MSHLIDDFTKDPHFKTLPPGAPQDIYSPQARETMFSIGGGNSWDQPITLDIGPHHGKGILIVNSGFDATAGLVGELRDFKATGGRSVGPEPRRMFGFPAAVSRLRNLRKHERDYRGNPGLGP